MGEFLTLRSSSELHFSHGKTIHSDIFKDLLLRHGNIISIVAAGKKIPNALVFPTTAVVTVYKRGILTLY